MAKRRQRSELSKIMSNKDRSNREWKFFVAWEAVNKDSSNHYLFESKGNQKYFFILVVTVTWYHGGNFEPPCHKRLWITDFGMS